MKVLILAQYFPPDMGGGATRAYNVAQGLSRAGCDVTVVSAFPHYPTGNIPKKYRGKLFKIEKEDNLRIVRTFVPPIPSKGFANRILLFLSFAFSSLLALPLTGKLGAVWAANPNIISVFPSLLYKLTNRCQLVQNVDDLWPEALYDLGLDNKSLLARIAEFVAKTAYKISSSITPISPAYLDVLVNKYGIDRKQISVVPAGVDASNFHFRKNSKKGGVFRILYIGAFSPAYDFDQVLMAADSLGSSANVDFVIQGGGELAPGLKRKVKESILNNVTVIDKIVSRNEVAEIMADADVLLLPLNGVGSIEMGISSKLYEYQAAGKPILCCSRGQPGRYVSETNSGIVIKPGDYETLAKSILYLKESPDVAEKLGKSGRQYVEDNLSIECIASKMMSVFKRS